MAIEKAFAIKADPAAIWDALNRELDAAVSDHYQIERRVRPELIELSLELGGGIPATLSYKIIPRDDHTEVVATMVPLGLRYFLSRVLTFGRVDTNYEIMLVEGLANLKRTVEDSEIDQAGDGERDAPPDR
ncbi:MAG: hypothetical protein IH958_00070 [Chloroflexi bacterium]|nr:hypothetical protein [Chloroflexota bacterium]